ncbi:MAG: PorP/SprF family type IX secretion system membrane protein [Saprospiraceae bacterium]|nr:PorP/SprF family type IX secretion system membrane protein [Saprospiraceae bacterium]
MNKTSSAVLLAILFLISMITSLSAQQIPLIQAYSFQPKILNPAAQGGASGGGILALYRNQFSDLPTSARPVTYLLQADVSPLIHDRIGVGLLAMQDKAALTKRTTVNGYFAYHLFPEQSPFRLSLGANAGILSQNMDLSTATVNNPNDLVLVNGMQSKTQFDGGVGLQLQYVQDNGSRLQLDASMPQLFTSNLSFAADGNATNNLKYDILPHAFASLLYRWQTSPLFALEPNVVYRESYSTGTAGGNVDLNLRLYFLENDRLMVGGGYRLDVDGLHFQLGVKPIENLQVFGAFESHDALGSTFEVGLQYQFGSLGGSSRRCTPGADETALIQQRDAAMAARTTMFQTATDAKTEIAAAENDMAMAQTIPDAQLRQSRLESADKHIRVAENLQALGQPDLQKGTSALLQAEQIQSQLEASNAKLCYPGTMEEIQAAVRDMRNIDRYMRDQITAAKNRRGTVPANPNANAPYQPPVTTQPVTTQPTTAQPAVPGVLDVNNPNSIRQYLDKQLAAVPNKPADARVSGVSASTFEIAFSDAEEQYGLVYLPQAKAVADWLVTELKRGDLVRQGLKEQYITIAADLRDANVNTATQAKYRGEFGNPFFATYRLNGQDQVLEVPGNSVLTRGSLAVAKAYNLKRYFASELGLPESAIQIEMRAPALGTAAAQTTKIVVGYKK